MADFFAGMVKQFRQMIQQVISVFFPELFRNAQAPRQSVIGEMRIAGFIRENARNRPAELLSGLPEILFMRNLNKFADSLFIEGVQIRFPVEPRRPFIVFPVKTEQLFPGGKFASLRFGNPAET